ncbi:AraC family transcriptional regulator [Flavobacterium sp. ASW18X]|uniref:helix-turn-helix domain-containing protein n=1 Tax=Flavobacterium sp. ASW18X TaxID=2572595 RepID=UPI0010AE1B7B|nr:AraC family transcriptional regulator [Flavobacterium sp. ASW18X]TKD63389.1 helix-turn-helix domain-containing protein [Flavobacterium sp. ASW18X]
MKNSYKKYLMVFDRDKAWGFYINNLGRTEIPAYSNYPSTDHPDSYMFAWENGRVLDEFHLVLITQGEGEFESRPTGKIRLMDGDVFLLFPGVWHRYKPKKNKGWTERWIGFSGTIAKQFITNGFFSPEDPIISNANQAQILTLFDRLFLLFEREDFGFQRTASALCLQLMAELYNLKTGGSNIADMNTMINRVKSIMYNRIDSNIELKEIAKQLGVSYSKFRLDFKKQTGVSPLQYFLSLKIEKAKELLLATNKTQKEIAFELGFESDFYFNRIFKKKTGMSPGKYRTNTKVKGLF